jgi:lipopolysaccharide/colanic/teichoic acid biosynthesis glycosyltransferase
MVTKNFQSDDLFRKYGKTLKFALDRVIAALALLLLSPLMLVIAIAVYFRMGSPILFTQSRAGKYGEAFKVYKFRSMTDARDENGNLLPDDERLTHLGKFLRRVKLDETLQLWNICRGQMSFVGPRPTVPEQVKNYNEFQKLRLLVNPGLTGWAQVNGNIELTWNERIYLDVWYLRNWSLWLDVQILIRTVAVVIWGEHRNEQALKQAVTEIDRSLKAAENKSLAETFK